ncbi:MAG TPA: hypothetical protein VMM36_11230 [Opitutaceae bacterium]|nr:hypothetical protein [Opitutaceae bacterium]
MQYLLLIHNNVTSNTAEAEWTEFIARAKESGTFRGGSELGARELIGSSTQVSSSAHIEGFMRFESDDKQKILDLLKTHPVVVHGGTVELCEMPES